MHIPGFCCLCSSVSDIFDVIINQCVHVTVRRSHSAAVKQTLHLNTQLTFHLELVIKRNNKMIDWYNTLNTDYIINDLYHLLMATSSNCNSTDITMSQQPMCFSTGLWWCPLPRSSLQMLSWCRLGLMLQRETPLLWEVTRSPPNVSTVLHHRPAVCPLGSATWSCF